MHFSTIRSSTKLAPSRRVSTKIAPAPQFARSSAASLYRVMLRALPSCPHARCALRARRCCVSDSAPAERGDRHIAQATENSLRNAVDSADRLARWFFRGSVLQLARFRTAIVDRVLSQSADEPQNRGHLDPPDCVTESALPSHCTSTWYTVRSRSTSTSTRSSIASQRSGFW